MRVPTVAGTPLARGGGPREYFKVGGHGAPTPLSVPAARAGTVVTGSPTPLSTGLLRPQQPTCPAWQGSGLPARDPLDTDSRGPLPRARSQGPRPRALGPQPCNGGAGAPSPLLNK